LSGDLGRARYQGRNVKAAGMVEPRDAVEVVEIIIEEPGRPRNLIKADRVVCHSFLLSYKRRPQSLLHRRGAAGRRGLAERGRESFFTRSSPLPLFSLRDLGVLRRLRR